MFIRAHRPIFRVLLALALACAVAGTAAASAFAAPSGRVAALTSPLTVRAGGQVQLTLRLASPPLSCLLAASSGSTQRAFARVRPTRTIWRWKWTVPASASSATWTFTVSCRLRDGARANASARLHVRGRRAGLPVLAGVVRTQQSGVPWSATTTTPVVTPPAIVPPVLTPPVVIPAVVAPPPASAPLPTSNPFQVGECTYWADSMRPDIIANAPPGDWASNGWEAKYWASNASAEGYLVDSIPQVGDIVVLAPGVDGAGAEGHVAYVQAVFPGQFGGDASITISEMNAGTGNGINSYVNSQGQVYEQGTMLLRGGELFIHQR